MKSVLELCGVEHKFRGLSVLQGVNLEVHSKEITGLIGPNGAGKSTLFNVVSGFLLPQQGKIIFEGTDITKWSVTQRSRAGLLRTFQTPQVFAQMTVHENLMAAGWLSTSSGFLSDMLSLPSAQRDIRKITERAEEIGERFELDSVWNIRAGDLPAGRQRLVELARATMASPRLLCLDEPSSGLNPEEIEELRRALERLTETGISILLVSHDMELMAVAACVHVLCFGEIIASGNFTSVKENPRVREAYLGV
jgi:ABC-type branched-subunit amino acid transport system ATPase component